MNICESNSINIVTSFLFIRVSFITIHA